MLTTDMLPSSHSAYILLELQSPRLPPTLSLTPEASQVSRCVVCHGRSQVLGLLPWIPGSASLSPATKHSRWWKNPFFWDLQGVSFNPFRQRRKMNTSSQPEQKPVCFPCMKAKREMWNSVSKSYVNLGEQIIEGMLYSEYFGLSWRSRFHLKHLTWFFGIIFAGGQVSEHFYNQNLWRDQSTMLLKMPYL